MRLEFWDEDAEAWFESSFDPEGWDEAVSYGDIPYRLIDPETGLVEREFWPA